MSSLWLCHRQLAYVFCFLSETINDLTFGAGVSYISLTHTPGSAQGKLPVILVQGGGLKTQMIKSVAF